ncbi:hypothetical protein Tco_1095062 [Tanacetum coccineum]
MDVYHVGFGMFRVKHHRGQCGNIYIAFIHVYELQEQRDTLVVEDDPLLVPLAPHQKLTGISMASKSMSQIERQEDKVAENTSNKRKW